MAERRPRPLQVRAVLFDLDGTLADTAADLGSALNRVRADRGLALLPLALLRPHASHGARGMLDAGFGIGKDSPDYVPLRDAFLDYYARNSCDQTRLFDDADRVLNEIERRGLRWGIVTNKISRFTGPVVEFLRLASRTSAIISGDSTPQTKPHPAPLLAAASLLAAAPEDCLYVGDAERDIMAGRAAGMKTLIARYGYIRDDETPAHWQADGEIDSLAELLDWLPGSVSLAPGI